MTAGECLWGETSTKKRDRAEDLRRGPTVAPAAATRRDALFDLQYLALASSVLSNTLRHHLAPLGLVSLAFRRAAHFMEGAGVCTGHACPDWHPGDALGAFRLKS